MLIHLPPRFEAAAHARNILEAVFNEVGGRAKTAVTVVAINDDLGLFVSILDKILNIAVMKMQGTGYVGGVIGTRITNIDKDALFLVEFFLGLVYLYLLYVVHYLTPCLCSTDQRVILQAALDGPAIAHFHRLDPYHDLRPWYNSAP